MFSHLVEYDYDTKLSYNEADLIRKMMRALNNEYNGGEPYLMYLIDSSGSMSNEELYKIINYCLKYENESKNNYKVTMAYFSDGISSYIREWHANDDFKQKIEKIKYQQSKDPAGGTEIGNSIIAALKLDKRYFDFKKTKLIVITDGHDVRDFSRIKINTPSHFPSLSSLCRSKLRGKCTKSFFI